MAQADTTYVLFHQLKVVVTNPVTIILGPEVCVIAFVMLFRWYGEREKPSERAFWRLSGKLAAGGLGLVVSGLLLFGSRAEADMQSSSGETRQFIQDFRDIGWVVAVIFTLFYFGVIATARATKGRAQLLLDPLLHNRLVTDDPDP